VLRLDKGGEYDSNVFHEFCKHHGIKIQFTSRYTPQQNGVVERKNITIMNMARSMLKEKQLSNDFWGEAISCSIYVLNRSPTKSVKKKFPQEAWTCMSCSEVQFRVFGCVAYAHVPKELRRKIDEKSEKCIFLGYNDQSKAYKLYNPVRKKVIISRSVEFKEDGAWDGSIDKNIPIREVIPQEEDAMEEKIAQGG
jgi:hypothetical protein